jgi:uncharacterized coiled-coil protein SlyX
MSLTRIPGSQVPVLEPTGLMSREWYRFLYNLFQLTGGGSTDITPAELQAEVDALEVQVAGISTEVNTLESSVDSLDTTVGNLQDQVDALADEESLSVLAPVAKPYDASDALQQSQLASLANRLCCVEQQMQSLTLAPPRVATSELNFGSFYDTTTQTAAAINTAYAITFDTSNAEAYGVYRGSTTSRIYITTPGVYNFQFSIQLDNTSGSDHLFWVWARVNGTTDVPYSASQVRLKGNNSELICALNLYLAMADTDYFELMYAVDNTGIQILATAAASPVPAIPSVILTVNQVSSPYGH